MARWWRRGFAVLLTAAAIAVLSADATPRPQTLLLEKPSTSTRVPDPGPVGDSVAGSSGVGDEYFPGYGNGGYDVQSYRLRLRYDPATDRLDGHVEIRAIAVQSLTAFNLDFGRLAISSLRVDGTSRTYRHDGGRELEITTGRVIMAGASFAVEVDYGGVPTGEAFRHTPDGAVVIGEPESATEWFPSNDHPRDKASYEFEITVPDGLTAVANGVPGGNGVNAGWRTWRWSQRDPMATYLATMVVGHFRVFEDTYDGLPVFSAVDADLPVGGQADAAMRRNAEIVGFFVSRFGPYPFESIGGIVTDAQGLSFALETQTRPVYGANFFAVGGPYGLSVVAHELAHQWFGDSVSLFQWRDIWLNEGFATYAEWMWDEHSGVRTVQQMFDYVYNSSRHTTLWSTPPGNPGPKNLFASSVYIRGGMALHALRVTIGDDAFFRVLREWTSARRYGFGTLNDFVELAERLAGRQLDELFRQWLFDTAKPPYPRPA